MASPKAKYSKSASRVTNPTASATIAVEPHKTIPTANGISTAAVATRFQVIEKESPQKSRSSSHHIERNKSRPRGFDPHPEQSFRHPERGDRRFRPCRKGSAFYRNAKKS